LERASAPSERLLADSVKDDIVGLAVLGEVLLRIVDDLVGTQRCDQLEVLRVAHRRDLRTEVSGQLHRGRADRSRGAVDEDAPSLAKISLSKAGKCEACSVADSSGLFERHACRLRRQRAAL